MTRLAVVAQGTAFPRLRLPTSELRAAWGSSARGVEALALPSFDEDAATLATEAAARAMEAAGVDPAALRAVVSLGPLPAAGVVAAALGAEHARLLDLHGTAPAALAALSSSLGGEGPALVVAAGVPGAPAGDPREGAEGSGAAAFVLDARPGAAVVHADSVASGPYADADVARAARPVEGAVDALVRSPPGLRVPGPGGKPVQAPAEPTLRAKAGDAGVAQPLVDLALALHDARPGARVLAAAAGDGVVETLVLEVSAAVAGVDPRARLGEGRAVTYLRALQERGVLAAASPLSEEPMGAFVPLPTFAASIPARWRLEGGRCVACARTFLPGPARCPACGAGVERHRFPPRGTVVSVTVIERGAAPSEFAEQQRQAGEYGVAILELEGGARVVGQITDGEPENVSIGDPLVPVLRRLYRQQGVVRYGLKWRRTTDAP